MLIASDVTNAVSLRNSKQRAPSIWCAFLLPPSYIHPPSPPHPHSPLSCIAASSPGASTSTASASCSRSCASCWCPSPGLAWPALDLCVCFAPARPLAPPLCALRGQAGRGRCHRRVQARGQQGLRTLGCMPPLLTAWRAPSRVVPSTTRSGSRWGVPPSSMLTMLTPAWQAARASPRMTSTANLGPWTREARWGPPVWAEGGMGTRARDGSG